MVKRGISISSLRFLMLTYTSIVINHIRISVWMMVFFFFSSVFPSATTNLMGIRLKGVSRFTTTTQVYIFVPEVRVMRVDKIVLSRFLSFSRVNYAFPIYFIKHPNLILSKEDQLEAFCTLFYTISPKTEVQLLLRQFSFHVDHFPFSSIPREIQLVALPI